MYFIKDVLKMYYIDNGFVCIFVCLFVCLFVGLFVCLLFVFPDLFLNSRRNLQERAQKNVCQNYGPFQAVLLFDIRNV